MNVTMTGHYEILKDGETIASFPNKIIGHDVSSIQKLYLFSERIVKGTQLSDSVRNVQLVNDIEVYKQLGRNVFDTEVDERKFIVKMNVLFRVDVNTSAIGFAITDENDNILSWTNHSEKVSLRNSIVVYSLSIVYQRVDSLGYLRNFQKAVNDFWKRRNTTTTIHFDIQWSVVNSGGFYVSDNNSNEDFRPDSIMNATYEEFIEKVYKYAIELKSTNMKFGLSDITVIPKKYSKLPENIPNPLPIPFHDDYVGRISSFEPLFILWKDTGRTAENELINTKVMSVSQIYDFVQERMFSVNMPGYFPIREDDKNIAVGLGKYQYADFVNSHELEKIRENETFYDGYALIGYIINGNYYYQCRMINGTPVYMTSLINPNIGKWGPNDYYKDGLEGQLKANYYLPTFLYGRLFAWDSLAKTMYSPLFQFEKRQLENGVLGE